MAYGGKVPHLWRRWGTVEGVASSSQFTVKLPIGSSYERVQLRMSGISHAQVTNLKVRINGAEVKSYPSGTVLELTNKWQDENYTSVAGVLNIDFRRMGMRQAVDRDVTILGTGIPAQSGEVTAATLEITGELASGLVSPAIVSYAKLREAAPLGILQQTRQFSITPSGTGEMEFSDLVRGRVIEWIGFDMSAGVFDEAKLELDGQVVFEGPIVMHNSEQNDGIRATQANWFFMDFNPYGDPAKWLDPRAASDLRIRLNITTAATIPFIVGTLGQLAR